MLKCEDCSHPYSEFGLDTTISNYQWSLIHPESSNGILCAKCMVQRASKLPGTIAARMVFEFAPHEAVEQQRALDGGQVCPAEYVRGYILGRSYMSPMPPAASNAEPLVYKPCEWGGKTLKFIISR